MSTSVLNEIMSENNVNAEQDFNLIRNLVDQDLLDSSDFVIRTESEERVKNMSDTQTYLSLWGIIEKLRQLVAQLQQELKTKKD